MASDSFEGGSNGRSSVFSWVSRDNDSALEHGARFSCAGRFTEVWWKTSYVAPPNNYSPNKRPGRGLVILGELMLIHPVRRQSNSAHSAAVGQEMQPSSARTSGTAAPFDIPKLVKKIHPWVK